MRYNLDFDICAMLLLGILLFSYYYKFRGNVMKTQNRIYITMVWVALFLSISDLFCGFMQSYPKQESQLLFLVIKYAYFAMSIVIPFLYAKYNVLLTGKGSKARIKIMLYPVLIIEYIFLVLNPWLQGIFYLDSKGEYIRGKQMGILYVSMIYYLLFGCIHITRNKGFVTLGKRRALYGFAVLMLFPIVIQFLYPNLLLHGLGAAFCLLLVFFTIQRPQDLLNHTTGMLNKNVFIFDTKVKFQTEEKFVVISISLDDWGFLYKIFGVDFIQELLCDIAEYLNTIRENLNVYHVSERTFVFLISNADKINVEELLDELEKKFKSTWILGETELPVDASICFMECPRDKENVEGIMECLNYLERNESNLKEKVIYAKDFDVNDKKRRKEVQRAVQRAIKEETLQVYYQPIYSTVEKRIVSAEALIRLKDEKLGFISPEEFIPIAERDGSILKIGKFVLESVCQFMRNNRITEKGIRYIEINVSVVECMKQDMAEQVKNIIASHGLEPGQINLEITETAASDSPEMLLINMEKLVKKGITFSLDDYGTGYSSVGYIIDLPFRFIKLDKGIVWASFESNKAGIAFESTVSMIQKLHMNIVAEGVETKEQADRLTEMGCEYLQGYYFSRPLPEEEFLAYLEK